MHILLFTSFYPSSARMTGTFFREQAQALHHAGHQVGVLVAPRIIETLDHIKRHRRLPNLKTADVEWVDDFPVYRMHWGWFPRVFPRICGWLTAPAGRRAFAHYVKQNGLPDIIHAHNIFYSGYMAVRIREQWPIPVVLTEHSTNFLRGRIFLPGQHHIARYTLSGVNSALAVSTVLADKLRAYRIPTVEIDTVHNVVNTEFFAPLPTSTLSPTFTFVVIGALIPRKGIDMLITAFARTFKQKTVQLQIVGKGPQRPDLERLVESLGLQSQVQFLGQLSREQVRDVLQNCHALVSSSSIETFGVTLIEALACGKPVVATRSGGPQEILDESNGILVSVGDEEGLATALQQMVAHYADYDSHQIRENAVARFSEKAVVAHLESIYQQIVQTEAS